MRHPKLVELSGKIDFDFPRHHGVLLPVYVAAEVAVAARNDHTLQRPKVRVHRRLFSEPATMPLQRHFNYQRWNLKPWITSHVDFKYAVMGPQRDTVAELQVYH